LVEENNEEIRGLESGFNITIGLGGEKCCTVGTEWWCMSEKEYPLKWQL